MRKSGNQQRMEESMSPKDDLSGEMPRSGFAGWWQRHAHHSRLLDKKPLDL